MSKRPTDEHILGVVGSYGTAGVMTYVVRNILASKPYEWRNEPPRPAFRNLDTSFVRRRLIALEKAGKVRRVSSNYAVQICWSLSPGCTPRDVGESSGAVSRNDDGGEGV